MTNNIEYEEHLRMKSIKTYTIKINIVGVGKFDLKEIKSFIVSDILNKKQEMKTFFTFTACANICIVKVISQGEIGLIS